MRFRTYPRNLATRTNQNVAGRTEYVLSVSVMNIRHLCRVHKTTRNSGNTRNSNLETRILRDSFYDNTLGHLFSDSCLEDFFLSSSRAVSLDRRASIIPVPRLIEKRIYRASVWQSLRTTGLDYETVGTLLWNSYFFGKLEILLFCIKYLGVFWITLLKSKYTDECLNRLLSVKICLISPYWKTWAKHLKQWEKFLFGNSKSVPHHAQPIYRF
jgi:hypothetical protein